LARRAVYTSCGKAEGTDVKNLHYILASAAAAIVGLLVYGLVPAFNPLWGALAAGATFGAIIIASRLVLRADDRDPTIRPTNVTRGDRRPKG
jgi:hypothetical protein